MIIQSKFKPAWWLPGPHLQTIWPTFMRRNILLDLFRERIELPDGDFIDLDWVNTENKNAPIVLVLHGLEGSIESKYARGVLKALNKNGFRPVFMHFRGCSGEHNRFVTSYHSGHTSDLAYIVNLLKTREPNSEISAVGFSLGGNVILKWLGETNVNNPLKNAVTVSVPFDLHEVTNKLDTGFFKIYQRRLLNSLTKKVKDKAKNNSLLKNSTNLNDIRSFWDFDNKITAPLFGFKDAMDYYQQSSCRQYLKNIERPTLILHAANDPFMTQEVIPTNNELSEQVSLEISRSGGHVGFVYGIFPGLSKYWLDERIPKFLKCQKP